MSDSQMTTIEELMDQGLTLLGKGNNEEAAALFRQVVAREPDHAEALRSLAMTCFHMGGYDEAIEAGIRLVALLPDDVLARTTLSMCYQKKGLLQDAEHEGAQARILGWKQQLGKSGNK